MKINTLFSQFRCFTEKILFVRPYGKRYESDGQMLQRVGRNFTVLLVIILMIDTLLDWFMGLIDLAIHLIHIMIEAIEYMLELLLSSTLHTTPQQSEMIIVNMAIIIALYLAYRLMLTAPSVSIRVKQHLLSIGLRFIKRESTYWRARSLLHKIKWLCAYSFGTACLLVFV